MSVFAGLDIGTTQIRVVVSGITEKNSLDFLGTGIASSTGLRQGVIINLDDTIAAVSEAIEAAVLESGYEVEDLFVGVSGPRIESVNSKGVVAISSKGKERKVSDDDIKRVVEAAKAIVIPVDREILHSIVREYKVDDKDKIKQPLNILGVRLEADTHIITAPVSYSHNIINCVKRSGYEVSAIFLNVFAAGRAVITTEEMELGVIHIDIGGGSTGVVAYVDGAPFSTFVLPVGGNNVSYDIFDVFKIPFLAADKIKITYGTCYPPMVDRDEPILVPSSGGGPAYEVSLKMLSEVAEARMAEIFEIIRDKLDRQEITKRIGGGVVITGGGALLNGTAELASNIFGVPARIGYPMGISNLPDSVMSPSYATCVGLALLGKDLFLQYGYDAGKDKKSSVFAGFKQWLRNFFE
ncbi:cell division protein FtsA [Spirochaetia bacterium 38H-sp]|uniref:Cell division protein FtsA n=1 Tax=Rarispira pelagica TaxID=3141764 RepID=A0ABU9UE03_9SPIR